MRAKGISCSTTRNKPRGRRKGQVGPTARAIREAVTDDLVERYTRMTVRQAYYQLEVGGVVEKTEAGYRQVQKQLLVMRREGLLDWSFITDGTRWQRKPRTWGSADDYIEHMARSYRRDLWSSQGVRLEFWLEKAALADTVVGITAKWDTALMVSRGQSSATFLHSAGKEAEAAYEAEGVETFIYTLYDDDAGGHRAAQAIEQQLPKFAPDVPIHIERLAVTPAQITGWNLPTRPAKKSDPQSAMFGPTAVELDAIPPDDLVKLVEGAILRHVDQHAWKIEQAIQQEERNGLRALREVGLGTFEDPRR